MDELFQKRAYELNEYVQLVLGEVGYENPVSIWIAVDRAGWPEAMKMSLIQFIDAISGGSAIYYLNNGSPWASQAAVLAGFPFESRNQFDTVNIMGVEYWFLADKVTLVNKFGSVVLTDGSVTTIKMSEVPSGSIMYRRSNENGPWEVSTLVQLKDDLNIPAISDATNNIRVMRLNYPDRIADATLPVDWEIAMVGQNLIVTHNMDKRVANVSILQVDGTTERVLQGNKAFSGWYTGDTNSLTIESLNSQYKLAIYVTFE